MLNIQIMTGIKWHEEEPIIGKSMDLGLHYDYPPSTANGRHTPKPPYP